MSYAIRIILKAGQAAKAGGRLADNAGSYSFSQNDCRPHEGLVVEARGQEVREPVVDRHEGRGCKDEPAPVLAEFASRPSIQLGHGGAGVRLAAARRCAARPARWALPSQRSSTPRGRWYLKRTAHQPHAVGEQGRGQRVALKPLVSGLPSKREVHRPTAADQPAVQTVHLLALAGAGMAISLERNRSCIHHCISHLLRPACHGHITGQFDPQYLMGHGVTGHHQPGAVALLVEPQLAVLARRVVAQIQVVVELPLPRPQLPSRDGRSGSASPRIGELLRCPAARGSDG